MTLNWLANVFFLMAFIDCCCYLLVLTMLKTLLLKDR